jgi:hypothetical protein
MTYYFRKMILNKKEKEDMVIKLLYEDLTFKEIAKRSHMSFSDISKIKRKITGDDVEEKINDEKPLSITSQAFKLFLENKKLVEVAISLNLSTEEAINIFSNYLSLQNMGNVAVILKEHRYNLPAFLKWFAYIKENKIKKRDIANAIDNVNKIKTLTQQKENLERELQSIFADRDCYLKDLENIKREYYK